MTQAYHLLGGRRAIPAAIRRQVIERDGQVCHWCSRAVSPGKRGEPYRADLLHIDHVVHWAAGGEHELENLVVACAECNLRRSKPTTVVRNAKVTAERRNNAHYWVDGYQPPVITSEGFKRYRLCALSRFAQRFDLTIAQVLRAIDRGLPATGGAGAIYVELPQDLWELEEERRQERRRERERVARAKRLKQGRRAKRRTDDLDPESVAYWKGLIDARRAREKAARAKR